MFGNIRTFALPVQRFAALCVATAAIGAVALPGRAVAQPVGATLDDGNTVAQFDTTAGSLTSFKINGIEEAQKQAFYYRVGATGGEQSLASLTLSSAMLQNGDPGNGTDNILQLQYTGTGFGVGISYVLAGGSGNSGSVLSETIKITNSSTTSSLDMHFFEYDHFTLNNGKGQQSATISNTNTADQTAAGGASVEVAVNPNPSFYQVGANGTILSSLTDSSPTQLTNAAGPVLGSPEFAFQWNSSIAPNGSDLISKVKTVTPAVPLPPAVWSGLAMLASLGGIAAIRRRRLA